MKSAGSATSLLVGIIIRVSSYNPSWRWVTVTGQLNQGFNVAPTGAICPGNYIIVSTVAS